MIATLVFGHPGRNMLSSKIKVCWDTAGAFLKFNACINDTVQGIALGKKKLGTLLEVNLNQL